MSDNFNIQTEFTVIAHFNFFIFKKTIVVNVSKSGLEVFGVEFRFFEFGIFFYLFAVLRVRELFRWVYIKEIIFIW